jgi:hypothetical protein
MNETTKLDLRAKRRNKAMDLLPEQVKEQVNLKILNGSSLRATLAWLRGVGYGDITYAKLWVWYESNYLPWLNRRQFSTALQSDATASKLNSKGEGSI